MSTSKRPTMLRLPPDLYEKIRALSYTERRSMNSEIEHAISAYIAAYESEHGVIPIQVQAEET